MASLQDQVNDVCRLADAVIDNPSTSVAVTAMNINVCAAIAGFAAGRGILFAPFLGPVGGLAAAVVYMVGKVVKNKKQQEKERMLREVICKQQAVIRKLEQELAKSRQQHEKNRQEIETLKEMLRMLEKTEEHIRTA